MTDQDIRWQCPSCMTKFAVRPFVIDGVIGCPLCGNYVQVENDNDNGDKTQASTGEV